MIAAMATLTSLGLLLGLLLSCAARIFRVPGNAQREEIMTLLPGVNCGQCGYPGCGGAADALIAGQRLARVVSPRWSRAGAGAGGQTGADAGKRGGWPAVAGRN